MNMQIPLPSVNLPDQRGKHPMLRSNSMIASLFFGDELRVAFQELGKIQSVVEERKSAPSTS